MNHHRRTLINRGANLADRVAWLVLGLTLVGIASLLLAILLFTVEPPVIVASAVVVMLYLVFRTETRPKDIPAGFHVPRSHRFR